MSHPSITQQDVRDNLENLFEGHVQNLISLMKLAGEGPPVDTSELDTCVADISATLDARLANPDEDPLDEDQFEGAMAAKLHACLRNANVSVLDDPGFWAYLATGPLWFLTKWRENPEKRKAENYHVYVDGTKNDSCVPLRMFLRAQAIVDGNDYSLAERIPKGVDFWRSHVIRVRSGSRPEMARPVVQEHVADRMMTDDLRKYAKRVNRRWSNQVLSVLDEEDCRKIAAEERPESD